MNTGRHYYEQMPSAVQQKFIMNVERSAIYTVEEVMQSEYMSHKLFILCPFHQFNSPEGKEYWHEIADENYSVEPDSRINTWFNNNTNGIAIAAILMSIVLCLIIAMLINKHNEERKQWKAVGAEKDSINAINRTNHITDSSNIVKQTYLPPGYDALLTKEEQLERMMGTAVIFEK